MSYPDLECILVPVPVPLRQKVPVLAVPVPQHWVPGLSRIQLFFPDPDSRI